MKTKAFQTKRKPKNGFRTLYAKTKSKTKKRKQRVSAAAAGGDFAGEEPNLGVARALVVILILHVAAIVAIVVHSSTNDSQLAVKDSPAVESSKKTHSVAATHHAAQPKIGPNDRYEYVEQGDTYERFARRHDVDVQELRRMNNNTPLKYGLALIVPQPFAPQQQVPAALAQVQQDPLIRETLPPIVDVPVRNSFPAEYEVVEAAQPIVQTVEPVRAPAPEPFPEVQPLPRPENIEAVRVSAPVVEQTPEPRREVVVEAVPPKKPEAAPPKPKPSTKSYTIRKGDTLWAIANRNGISVDKLMAANRNINPKKMRPGIKVQIPSR